MRIALLIVVIAMAGSVIAQPDSVLVFHDTYGGFGNAVTTAIGNVWPSTTLDAFTGETGYVGFNSALTSGNYDVIIIECWYYDTDNLDWASVTDIYDTAGETIVYVSSWEWEFGASGQMDLANKMGVYLTSPDYSWNPHYVWEPGHPIVDGIADWTQSDPGVNIKNAWMAVSNATPITGWSDTPTVGEAGICVAGDGTSVISGFTLGYANSGVAIWENILNFWYPAGALQQSTWGAIKSSF